MRLKNLQLVNFGSFEELDYDFVNHPTLIQGQNLTDDSQDSNGSGKSWLQSGIEYCLVKTTSRKVTDSELVRRGCDQSYLQLEIYCPIRKESIVIGRTIKLKGSGTLSIDIWKDGADEGIPQSFATVLDGDKLILRWLDIEKDDLYNFFIVNKERYKSFFQSSNTDKNATINRFSNAQLISGVEKFVESDVTKLNSELKKFEDEIIKVDTSIDVTKLNIEKEKNRDLKAEMDIKLEDLRTHKIDKSEAIDDCNETIKQNNLDIDVKNKEIKKKQDEVKELQVKLEETAKSLKKIAENDFTKDYEELTELSSKVKSKKLISEDEKKTEKKTKSEIELLLSDINKNLQGSVKCPKCSHEFIPGEEVNIEEERIVLKETEEVLSEIEITLSKIEKDIEVFENELSTINIKKGEIDKKKDEIQKQKDNIRKNVDSISNSISTLNNDITRLESKIKNINLDNESEEKSIARLKLEIEQLDKDIENIKEGEIDTARIKVWEEEIKGFEATKLEVQQDIEAKKSEIYKVQQWITNFTKFNMFLANKSLKVIQGYCNKFLQEIGSDIQIKWEGQKMLKNGEKRDKISAYIIRDNEEREYWSFSGGERGRMDYAMILTLQHMINSTNKYGGLEFLSTDEIAEGIDSQGLGDLMKALNKLDKSIWVTTHVVNKNVSENTLMIVKENGISMIKN